MASGGYRLRARERVEMEPPKTNDDDAVTTTSSTTTVVPKRKKPSSSSTDASRVGAKQSRKPTPTQRTGQRNLRSSSKTNDQRQKQPESDHDDDSMDELLADLRPLRQRASNDAARIGAQNAATGSNTEPVEDDSVILVQDDANSQAAGSSRPSRSGYSDRQLQNSERNSPLLASSRRARAPPPAASNRTMPGNPHQTVVITLSDSDDESQEREVVVGQRDSSLRGPVTVTVQWAEQPWTGGDEEYARRLQRELNREYWREALIRRAQRVIAYSDLENDSNTGSATSTTRPPTLDPEAIEERRAEAAERTQHPPANDHFLSVAASLIGSTGVQPPRTVRPPPTLTAFHRRPVPGGSSSQTGRQINTRSTQARGTSTTSGEDRTQQTLREHLSRIRRLWFHRAVARHGDFEQLESALLDLALALGDGLNDEQIDRLPVGVYSSSSGASTTNTTCTICMEEFADRDVQRHLPCVHTFHKNCIDVWLKQKSTCPICRVDARSDAAST